MNHAEAVLALLAEDANLITYDGEVPDLPVLPYAVVWMALPLHSADRLGGSQANATLNFQTTSVGVDPNQARRVQARIRALLLDRRLDVAGYRSARVKHEAAPPVQADHDVDPSVFTAVDQWSVLTVPESVEA